MIESDLEGIHYEATITPSDLRDLKRDGEIEISWPADDEVPYETVVTVHVDESEDGSHKVTETLE